MLFLLQTLMFRNQRVSELQCSQAFLQACLGQKFASGLQHLQMKVLHVMFLVLQKLLPMVSVPENLNCLRSVLILDSSFRTSRLYMHLLHFSPDQSLLGWNSQDQAMVYPDPLPWLGFQTLEQINHNRAYMSETKWIGPICGEHRGGQSKGTKVPSFRTPSVGLNDLKTSRNHISPMFGWNRKHASENIEQDLGYDVSQMVCWSNSISYQHCSINGKKANKPIN